MSKHKICEGCKFNNYPTCSGIIMYDGIEMNIENLRECFNCGQKDLDNITDFSIRLKSELELKIENLEIEIEKLKK